MSELSRSISLQPGMGSEAAVQCIKSFQKRFGEAHLYLALHAAFPVALTPDLLYRLWANFQRDINGELLNIPWVAVADLLLSHLCTEVGYELYEMEAAVRNKLLQDLKANHRLGTQRINDLANFLLEYVRQQQHSQNPEIRDFALAQRWTALAYIQPPLAAEELAKAFSQLNQMDKEEIVRMASLVEMFAEPLAEFAPLLIYARGMAYFARGNRKDALAQFGEVLGSERHIRVARISLPVPKQILAQHARSSTTKKTLPRSVKIWKPHPEPLTEPTTSFPSFNAQLAAFGFHRDPFAFPDAENIDPETLEETFVAHPGFNEQVLDLSRSAVLLASSGTGKTAGRRMFEMSLNEHRRQILSGQQMDSSIHHAPLAVNYCNFEPMVGRLPNIGLADHAAPLLAAIAQAIYGFIREQLDHVMATSQQEREWWSMFLRAYLQGEDINAWMLAGPLAPDWQRTRRRNAPFRPNSTLMSILDGLRMHLAGIGIHRLYILVDGVDGYLETLPVSNLEALVAPLLNTLSLFSAPYVWKFFLPSTLEQLVYTSAGCRTGRLNRISILWDTSGLVQFLQHRLAWASDDRIRDVAALCDQQLLGAVDVEQELVRMTLRHRRLGPPRALLDLASWLLRSWLNTARNTMLLSLGDWNNFKNQVSHELIPRLFISYTHEDRSFVERLAANLRAYGLHVWLDLWEMRVGDSILQKINEGIADSDYLIVVLSPDSINSRWVQEELGAGHVGQANGQRVRILPVLFRDCRMPPLLRQRVYADFRTNYRSGLEQLVKAFEPSITIS